MRISYFEFNNWKTNFLGLLVICGTLLIFLGLVFNFLNNSDELSGTLSIVIGTIIIFGAIILNIIALLKSPKLSSDFKTVVVDGNNVAWSNKNSNNKPRFKNLDLAYSEIHKHGFDPVIVISGTLRYTIDEKENLEKWIKETKIIQAPSKEYDDRYILMIAKKLDAAVLSNDLYRDLREEFPWYSQKRLSFSFVNDNLLVIDWQIGETEKEEKNTN